VILVVKYSWVCDVTKVGVPETEVVQNRPYYPTVNASDSGSLSASYYPTTNPNPNTNLNSNPNPN